MKCPKCGAKINPAAMLASKAKGKPKHFSQVELLRRKWRLEKARKIRWSKKPTMKIATDTTDAAGLGHTGKPSNDKLTHGATP